MCALNIMMGGVVMSSEEAMLLDSQENVAFASEKNAGERKHLARLPCFRLCGPLVDIVIDPGKHSKHHALGFGHNYC